MARQREGKGAGVSVTIYLRSRRVGDRRDTQRGSTVSGETRVEPGSRSGGEGAAHAGAADTKR
jgi:hypothetical protein